MPAQLFPMMNDVHNAMMMERMQNQQEYRQALLGFREASLQKSQDMEPMRQQVMAQEFKKNQLMIQNSLSSNQREQSMLPFQQKELQARTDEANQRTEASKFTSVLDLHKALAEDRSESMRQALMGQTLRRGEQDMAFGAASNFSRIATEPVELKTQIMDGLVSKGLASRDVRNAVVNTNIGADKVEKDITDGTGNPLAAERYRDLGKQASQPRNMRDELEASIMAKAGGKSFISPADQAELERTKILHQAALANDRRNQGLSGFSDQPQAVPTSRDGSGPDLALMVKDQVYQVPMTKDPKTGQPVHNADMMPEGTRFMGPNGKIGIWTGTGFKLLGDKTNAAK